ncbi:uncharacterized protein [Oscarella lobularis]|uniref:uncharacterized protein n=1 Tax=Oscarella lobularis TaxID=121494 RepID=UPI00331358CA
MEESDADNGNGLVNDSWVNVAVEQGEAPSGQRNGDENVQVMLAEAAVDVNGSEQSASTPATSEPEDRDVGEQTLAKWMTEEETMQIGDWDAAQKKKESRVVGRYRFSLRGTWCFRNIDLLVPALPVLICSHLISFVIGIFIGHRYTVST